MHRDNLANPEMRLEVVLLLVADVDRARDFYVEKFGFNPDFDSRPEVGVRPVQLTPHGSSCSLVVGSRKAKEKGR